MWVLLLFSVYVVGIIFFTWPITAFYGFSLEKLASFGDSFGALTALFSGLAFWVALHLLNEQKNEFSKLVKQTEYSANIQRSQIQPQFSISITESYKTPEDTLVSFENQNKCFFQSPELSHGNVSFRPHRTSATVGSYQDKVVFILSNVKLTGGSFMDGEIEEGVLVLSYFDISGYRVKLTVWLSRLIAEPRELSAFVSTITMLDQDGNELNNSW